MAKDAYAYGFAVLLEKAASNAVLAKGRNFQVPVPLLNLPLNYLFKYSGGEALIIFFTGNFVVLFFLHNLFS